MNVSVEGKKGNQELVIRIPIESDLPISPTGKTRRVASSNGNVTTSAVLNGKPIVVGLNAWISIPKEEREKK